jgi:hypothetical protein
MLDDVQAGDGVNRSSGELKLVLLKVELMISATGRVAVG